MCYYNEYPRLYTAIKQLAPVHKVIHFFLWDHLALPYNTMILIPVGYGIIYDYSQYSELEVGLFHQIFKILHAFKCNGYAWYT